MSKYLILLALLQKLCWGPCVGYTNASQSVMILLYTKVSFSQFCEKNLTVAGVFRKDIWFSLPIPKIKLDPPPQGRNALVFIF